MATSVRTSVSTRDKLLRARKAAAQLAQLSTAREERSSAWRWPNAIVANAAGIIEANQADLNNSGLAGAMRERLLLNPERVTAMANGMREVAEPSRSGRRNVG